jgi:hypothetical protein
VQYPKFPTSPAPGGALFPLPGLQNLENQENNNHIRISLKVERLTVVPSYIKRLDRSVYFYFFQAQSNTLALSRNRDCKEHQLNTMSIYCVAYIGKFNEPLYFFSKEDTSEYLHLQMIVHSCLDVVEERKKR